MKITVIVLLAACLQVSAAGYSQITITEKNVSLLSVLKQIQKQSGHELLYSADLLKKAGNVSIDVTNVSLQKALDICLDDKDLTYTITERTIIIKPKAENTSDKILMEAEQPAIVIKGKVTNNRGESLPGVTVVAKVSKKGAVTNANGEYELQITVDDKALVFSCIGYMRQEVAINNRRMINLALIEEVQQMKDVVITGLYVRPKENYTGSARTIEKTEISRISNDNVFNAIRSFDPSFQLTENLSVGSNPNVLPNLVLRGGNSLVDPNSTSSVFGYTNALNTPLFILDGFEVNIQRIYDLDVNRIQSVVLLKDATATAIYGSRAANGVVVIETVPPELGKLKVTYTGNAVLETPDLSSYNLLKAREKYDLEVLAISTFPVNFYQERRNLLNNFRLGEITRGVETDWISQPVRNAYGQKHSLFIEGGDKTLSYALTGMINQRNGVMKGSGRNNSSFGSALSYRYKGLLFKNDLTLNFSKALNSPYGSFADYVRMNPYWAPRDANGNIPYYVEYLRDWNGTVFSQYTNPLFNTTLNIMDQSSYQNFIENFNAEWAVNDWLKLRGRVSYQKQSDESDKFLPAQHTSFAGVTGTEFYNKGSYTKTYGRNVIMESTVSADANKRFGESMIYASLGSTLQDNAASYEGFKVVGFPNDRLDQLLMGNRYPTDSKPTGTETHKRLAGYFANVSYSYNNKYLLDGSYRLDGSSLFGTNRRFASFWSAGAGWNVHNEKFFVWKDWVSRLKLKYSVGYTGSQNFESYLGMTTYNFYTTTDYRYNIGAYLLGYGNENLGWQRTLKNNYGFELTALKQHLDVIFNYFVENTEGSVASISVAPSTGFNSYKENLGNVNNKGWELNSRIMIFNRPQARENLSLFFNAFQVKSVIKKISNQLEALNAANATALTTKPLARYVDGQSMTAIWAVQSLGIDPSTGKEIYLKRDGTTTNTWSPLDEVVIADSRPKLEGTFGVNFEFKGFGANIYFRYRYGGYAYNQTLVDKVETADYNYNVDRRVYEARWKKPGDMVFFKGIVDQNNVSNTNPTYASSRFVQKDDLFTLENASLFYRFSDKLNKRIRLQNTKITMYMGDLLYLSTIRRERGIDYPYSHTITLQLQTSF